MQDAPTTNAEETVSPAEKPEKRPSYEYRSADWDGRFRRVVEVMPKLAAFREWFMENRFDPSGKKVAIARLVDSFNEAIVDPVDRDFWPQPKFLKRHADVWEAEMAKRQEAAKNVALHRLEIQKQLAVTAEQADAVQIELVPTEESSERKMRTLGDFLLDDAMEEMVQAAEELGPESDPELALKRKKYALNVYSMVVKTVQRDKELALKMKADDRENAGFMMNLINAAIAGKMTSEMLAVLKGSVHPVVPGRLVDSDVHAA